MPSLQTTELYVLSIIVCYDGIISNEGHTTMGTRTAASLFIRFDWEE